MAFCGETLLNNYSAGAGRVHPLEDCALNEFSWHEENETPGQVTLAGGFVSFSATVCTLLLLSE